MSGYWRGPASDERRYGDLIASAERVGVTLPPALLKFLQNPELQKRIPSSNAAYFYLGEGGLCKVPRSLDEGAGGYLIRILSDQQGCYSIHLYLEPSAHGGHCLLHSGPDYHWLEDGSGAHFDEDGDKYRAAITDHEMQEAEEMGVRVAQLPSNPYFQLLGVDFEEWLARMYYDESLWYLLETEYDKKCASKGLKEYVRRNFVSKFGPNC